MTIIFKTIWFWKILVIKPWRQSLCTLVGRQAVLESFIVVETLAVWTQEVELSCVRSTRTYTVSELSDHCGDTEGFERPVTTRKNPHTWLRDRAGVDLTVVAPSHSDGAATLLLGDVGGQNTVAENRVVEVQVTLLLLLCQDSNRCNGWIKTRREQMSFCLSLFSNAWISFLIWENQCWPTLTAAFVFWLDITMVADTLKRTLRVLTSAKGLAQSPVHSTFVNVWQRKQTVWTQRQTFSGRSSFDSTHGSYYCSNM